MGSERAGEGYPTKTDSSNEEEEEGEVTLLPLSPPLIIPPRLATLLVDRWGLQSVSTDQNKTK
jgi:hypothetical protein